jgi:hypothetical protein
MLHFRRANSPSRTKEQAIEEVLLVITTKTFQAYEQLAVSSQQTLPVTPYPAKHVHCAFDDLKSAVRAVQALRAAGFDPEHVTLMASWHFVGAVDSYTQQPRRFSETIRHFLSFFDDSFDVYLREAGAGRHILAVRITRHEHIMQVRNVLAPQGARLVKYIDTWTTADLS